jgi:hypothetical protein
MHIFMRNFVYLVSTFRACLLYSQDSFLGGAPFSKNMHHMRALSSIQYPLIRFLGEQKWSVHTI